MFYDPNTAAHHHLDNVDTGELTDIDASRIEIAGLPQFPGGVVADGVDIILRLRSRAS